MREEEKQPAVVTNAGTDDRDKYYMMWKKKGASALEESGDIAELNAMLESRKLNFWTFTTNMFH